MKKYIHISIIFLLITMIGCSLYQLKYINTNDLSDSEWTMFKRRIKNKDPGFDTDRFTIVGKVIEVKGREIVFGMKNVKQKIMMNERIFIIIGNKKVKAIATFPMQTVVKCKLIGRDKKYLKDIKKGAAVVK